MIVSIWFVCVWFMLKSFVLKWWVMFLCIRMLLRGVYEELVFLVNEIRFGNMLICLV